MKKSLSFTGLIAGSVLAVAMAGCGKSDESSSAVVRPAESSPAPAEAVSGPKMVEMPVNDGMVFEIKRMEVAPGQDVRLTLRHTGRMPKEAMGHNWVLLAKGTDKTAFAMSAAMARETDYLPVDKMDQVLAHTKMIGGGQIDTITFTAPEEPGEYDYICSFPGHTLAGMVGVLVVR